MRSERIEGHEWGAYVMLVRSSVTEHGMAYGPRGPRSRSSNSSRGRHAPPGRTGEPSTGRSGAGGRIIGYCEVREMRNAEAVPVIVRVIWKRPLESYVIPKGSCVVRRGAVGKVPKGNSLAAYPTVRAVLRGLGGSDAA